MAIENRENKLNIFQREIYIVIQKVINFSIIGNNKYNKQQREIENVRNDPKPYPIKKEMINFEKFFGETYNSYPQENIKFQTDKDHILSSLINNNSTKNNQKNKFKKHIFGFQTNNGIRILKNNKLVYLNKKLFSAYSNSRAIKKFKKINFIVGKKRSSKYRGVSKNGNKWQVLIMINNKKYYLGNYNSEDLAARIYDIQAIKSWGVKARTNFVYDDNQITKIYNKKINFKCNNISDIMTQLNN